PSRVQRLTTKVEGWLDGLDHRYALSLEWVLKHRALTIVSILGVFAFSLLLSKRIGTEFFPDSDESQLQVIFKTPIGTRVEKTEQVSARMEQSIWKTLPRRAVTTLLTDVGLPGGRTALCTANSGPHTGNIGVNLVPKSERSSSDVKATEDVRRALRDALPGIQIYFFTGGIVKRILNFGAAAPIDVEILGYDLDAGGAYAK